MSPASDSGVGGKEDLDVDFQGNVESIRNILTLQIRLLVNEYFLCITVMGEVLCILTLCSVDLALSLGDGIGRE